MPPTHLVVWCKWIRLIAMPTNGKLLHQTCCDEAMQVKETKWNDCGMSVMTVQMSTNYYGYPVYNVICLNMCTLYVLQTQPDRIVFMSPAVKFIHTDVHTYYWNICTNAHRQTHTHTDRWTHVLHKHVCTHTCKHTERYTQTNIHTDEHTHNKIRHNVLSYYEINTQIQSSLV